MEQDDPGRTLLESNYILLGIIAFHSATGTWMLFLSIPILGRPQTSIRLKNVLVEHFFVGAFACITAIIRIPFVLEINLLDVDYTLVPFSVWSAIECDMKMVTVCLPPWRRCSRNGVPDYIHSRDRNPLQNRTLDLHKKARSAFMRAIRATARREATRQESWRPSWKKERSTWMRRTMRSRR
jgi:hypothetical protein